MTPHRSATAHILYTIASSFGDIEGMKVADLGCGFGVLGIGAALLDAL